MPRHICYLNAASYSPLPLRTQEAGRAAVARKATPWTLDAGFANAQYERTRAAAARLTAEGFTGETVSQPDDGDWTSAVLAIIDRPGAPPVGLASISSVHWSDGGLIDVDAVRAALRRQGALFLIDATQGAGVLAMDVKRLDPDFVLFPTYKWLLGPYGRAFMYIAKRP